MPKNMSDKPEPFWKVRELAVTARVSVAKLLQEAGVGTSTVHQWKSGQSKPRARTIQRLNAAAERLRERAMQ